MTLDEFFNQISMVDGMDIADSAARSIRWILGGVTGGIVAHWMITGVSGNQVAIGVILFYFVAIVFDLLIKIFLPDEVT